MSGLRIRVYECIKGVTKVTGLQKEDLASGTKIGVLPAAVSLLLAEDRIEFSVVLEGKRPQKNGSHEILWLGYHFFGQFANLQRCFRKKHRDLESIFSILHKNLTTKFSDPFLSPLLLMGDNNAKGFWQISSAESPHEVLGFIPLHRTDMFHTMKSYPIIFFEGDQSQVIVGSDLDRNYLYHSHAELDTAYTNTLRKLSALYKTQKWTSVVLQQNTTTNTTDTSKNPSNTEDLPDINAGQKFDMRPLSHWLANHSTPLTLVYGLSLWRKGTARDFDLATLGSSGSGRSHLIHYLHSFTLSPHYKEDADNSNLDLAGCKVALDKLVDDLKEMKSIVAHGTAIYNPFFEKSRVAERGNLPNPSLVLESQSLKLPQHLPKPSTYKFPQLATPVFLDPPATTTSTESSFPTSDDQPPPTATSSNSNSSQPPAPHTPPNAHKPTSPSPTSFLAQPPQPMSPENQQQLVALLQQRQQSIRHQRQQNTPPPTSPTPSSTPSSSDQLSHATSTTPNHQLPPVNTDEASQFLLGLVKNSTKEQSLELMTPAKLQSGKQNQSWPDPGIVQSGKPVSIDTQPTALPADAYGVDARRLAQALARVMTNPNYNFRLY